MFSFDVSQAERFLTLLTGNSNQPHCFQVFWDDDTPNAIDTYRKSETFHATLEDSVEYFNGVQAHNYGVYVTLNKTDGKGRELENIMGYRALFADFDNLALPKFPIQPHFVTQRDATHSHAYWLVDGVVTGDQFKRLQKMLAVYFGSDEQVIDPSRVVRLAGTYNMKNPAVPAMYNIVGDYTKLVGKDHRYNVGEIEAAFKLDGEKLQKLDQWCNSRNSLDTGEGFNDNPVNRNKMIAWLGRAEPAVKGNGRSMGVIKVASMGYDLGIPLAECQQLMWDHYNDRIEPPYGEQDRVRKLYRYVERAYKYANNVAGCRTTTANFSAAGDVPEPVGGWEENAKLGKVKVDSTPTIQWSNEVQEQVTQPISNVAAATALAACTNKTPPVELAQIFIALNYPDGGLVRCGKVYYQYTGRCWKEIDDDDVRSQVVMQFLQFKFPPSKISNIVTYVEDLCYFANLTNNTWLKGDYNGANTLVCNNTLVDLTGETKLIPHTRDFFTMNELGYDYDPNAKCPELIKFLHSIWGEGNPLIGLLQEAMGYTLTSDASFQKIIMLIGKSRGGKSVIVDLISQMLGVHNTVSPTLESVVENSMLDAMSKAKLIAIPEATSVHPSAQNKVLGIVKAISGNDSLSYHRMYKGSFRNDVWGKMLMVTNSMPDFVDTSGALANRFIIFPFTESFKGREDHNLPKRLSKEIAGVLNWAIEGLRRLQANNGFTNVTESEEIVEDMKRDMFPLADFCDDFCDVGNGYEITSSMLYKGYQYYCKQKENKNVLSANKFGKFLKASYLPVSPSRMKDKSRSRGFKGIKIKPEYEQLLSVASEGKVISFPAVNADNNANVAHIPPPPEVKEV